MKNFLPSLKEIINRDVPMANESQNIGDVVSMLKKSSKSLKAIDYIYITDKNERLAGLISIEDVFAYPKSTPLKKIMQTKIISAPSDCGVEELAHFALRHDLKAVPIVDSGKLVGVVSPKKLIFILNKSLSKDILHFAGIHRSHLQYENSLEVPLQKSVIHRMPWLIVGLIGIIMVAAFIGVFENTLEKNIILAFFIPAIVYVSSALGTQHQTLFTRDLAIIGKELKFKKYFLKQTSIAILMAMLIFGIMFLAIYLFWGQPYIAFVISLATFISIILTSITSLMITAALQKLGSDPALGGGPFATIISDATSIIIYFLVANLLL